MNFYPSSVSRPIPPKGGLREEADFKVPLGGFWGKKLRKMTSVRNSWRGNYIIPLY
jgi:hypothetical protein